MKPQKTRRQFEPRLLTARSQIISKQDSNSNIDCIPCAGKARMCSFPGTLPE